MGDKVPFQDFLDSVDEENKPFVRELHEQLMALGCKADVKQAKSGYVVSYSQQKKTVANYVFRKKGIMVRIYANHLSQYPEILDTLPGAMVQTIREAPVCKRLMDPDACNPKCAMGYEFILRGERLQRCRNGAFLFFLREETGPFIKALLMSEVQAPR